MTASGPTGLVLPPDLVQPLLLRFRREDLHIMAFFVGHPDYEAVEAMIRYRADGSPAIRAILTRHDQTQIDHVNDEAQMAEARGVERRTARREIRLVLTAPPGRRQARLEFVSHAGESVVLDVTTLGEPDTRRAGVSSPGSHSPNSSLPLMLRRASVLAAPQTQVLIDGRRFDVPVKLRIGTSTAHEGYYTEGHIFGVIRAGVVRLRLRARPDRLIVGSEWLFEDERTMVTYRIQAQDGDGRFSIVRGDGMEAISASASGDGLRIHEIVRRADSSPGEGLRLSFDDVGRFRLTMEGEDIVAGALESHGPADARVVTMAPSSPDWALSRQIQVHCTREGDMVAARTSIGGARPSAIGDRG
jgi:hypothetical protein